ncbi:MAG: type II toxin-antitoxin system ParD family antitoxin [Methylococcales bacterium]
MPMQRKTISITQQMSSWVKSQVESGQYGNDSEYFRDLIRSDQQKKQAESQLLIMLEDAESKGLSKRSVDEIWGAIEIES